MEIVIRIAERDDVVAAWAIRNSSILAQCPGFYPDDLLTIWTAARPAEHVANVVIGKWYVATVGDEVVGTGKLDEQSGHIDAIFVRPDMMSRRIGARMMEHLEQLAVQAGLTELTLDATLNAAPFYRKCGFVGEKQSIYESPRGISLACVPMTKHLSQFKRAAESRGE